MAVCAQDFKVLQIGPPVFNPSRPRPLAIFWADLLIRLKMVQFQNPNVRDAASCAGAAKVCDDLRPCSPIGLLFPALVDCILAFRAAISGDGRLAAAKALAAVIPSAGRVTAGGTEAGRIATGPAFLYVESRSAKFASLVFAFFGAVRWQPLHALVPPRRAVSLSAGRRAILSAGAPGEGRPAFGASVVYRFHGSIIAQDEPRAINFDIACRRVDEAARQPDLLIPAPKVPVQEGFDLG